MEPTDKALDTLLALIEDYHDFNPSRVEVFQDLPTSVEFCKQVSKGIPCVYPVSSLIKEFKASRWTKQDLIAKVKETVEVAVTPNGRADSLCRVTSDGDNCEDEERVFLQPASIDMTLEEVFEKLEHVPTTTRQDGPVYYLQSQNGNLTNTSLAPLFEDLPKNFPFAEDVVGEPEAVNIWIGDERSVTSTHRDPYENLYLVLRGSKIFTLWSPVDEVCMDTQLYRTGHYKFNQTTESFTTTILDHEEKIPWVPIDPTLPRSHLNTQHPLYKHAKPRTITLDAGQMLYLPSGWYHHVEQRCGLWDDGTRAPCISVNYWYDQDYEGEKHVMRQLIGRLSRQVQQGDGNSDRSTRGD